MKHQALFSSKDKSKKIKLSSDAVETGALRVNTVLKTKLLNLQTVNMHPAGVTQRWMKHFFFKFCRIQILSSVFLPKKQLKTKLCLQKSKKRKKKLSRLYFIENLKMREKSENSVELDELALNELSHLNLCCLKIHLFCILSIFLFNFWALSIFFHVKSSIRTK